MAFNILVVDDSETIRAIVAKTLKIAGVPVSNLYQASNGKEALETLKKEWIDVVFADINMPVMDGMECTRNIRAMTDPEKARIPIIAITGNAQNYSIAEFKEAGIDDYLPKPLNFDVLVETVKKYTEG